MCVCQSVCTNLQYSTRHDFIILRTGFNPAEIKWNFFLIFANEEMKIPIFQIFANEENTHFSKSKNIQIKNINKMPKLLY